jgi:hypothetical protein
VLSKVESAKRHQACKMPEALGARLNEPWQHAINKKNVYNYIIIYQSKICIFSIKIRSLENKKI